MALTGKGGARRRSGVEALERPQYGWIWKPLLVVLVLYLLVTLVLGIWWSRTPAAVAPDRAAVEQRGSGPAARGVVTTAGLMSLLQTLLDKPGGYLRNDLSPPGLWLDNMPAWELGVLSQARRLARALPAMEGEGRESATLEEVQERLQVDSRDWFYPSTEHRLAQASSGLGDYLARFGQEEQAGFAAGGQGLAPWLLSVARSLDELGLRLSASVGSHDALRDLDIETEAIPVETPWYRVDNVFFEARGQTWALRQLLEAVHHDQADALEAAGLAARWEALVVELELSQRRLWSPLVLNGSGFGLFANHSLVMANHVVRARDLARELAEGLAMPVAAEAPESPPAEPAVPEEEGEATAPMAGDEAPVEDDEAVSGRPDEAGEEAAGADVSAVADGADEAGSGEAPSAEAGEGAGQPEAVLEAEGEGGEPVAPEPPAEH